MKDLPHIPTKVLIDIKQMIYLAGDDSPLHFEREETEDYDN